MPLKWKRKRPDSIIKSCRQGYPDIFVCTDMLRNVKVVLPMGPPGVRQYCRACPCDIVILKAESAMKREGSMKVRRTAPRLNKTGNPGGFPTGYIPDKGTGSARERK